MKVFQIVDGFCFWDATKKFSTVGATVGFFPESDLFVETPDYVFEGWGYDEDAAGDERFIKPETPEGWRYDDETGTFYPEQFVKDPDTGRWYDPEIGPPEPSAEAALEKLLTSIENMTGMGG